MKKILFSLLIMLLGGYSAMAQLITFDDQGHADFAFLPNPYSITNGAETFQFTFSNGGAPLPGSHRYRTSDTDGCNVPGAPFGYLRVDPSATTWTMQTVSGNEINLGNIRFLNMYFCYGSFAYSITVTGFKNGTSTGSQPFSVTNGNSVFTPNASFDDVDRVVITSTDIAGLGIDDINWGPVISACTDPTVPIVSATVNPVCSGGNTILNISGTLNDATQWAIYSGSCGGTPVGTTATNSFTVTPVAPSTTYFIRGEGGCVTPGSCSSITINVNTISLTQASQTNIACNGGATGAAVVNAATGGTGPYTYNWTPGNPVGDGTTSVSGLSAGTWTCNVTDANGCTSSVNFTITQPGHILK